MDGSDQSCVEDQPKKRRINGDIVSEHAFHADPVAAGGSDGFFGELQRFWFCQNRIIYLHEMTEKAAHKKAGPEFGILPGVPRLQKGVADKNNGIAKKEDQRSKCKSGKVAALFQKQENPGRKKNPEKAGEYLGNDFKCLKEKRLFAVMPQLPMNINVVRE